MTCTLIVYVYLYYILYNCNAGWPGVTGVRSDDYCLATCASICMYVHGIDTDTCTCTCVHELNNNIIINIMCAESDD